MYSSNVFFNVVLMDALHSRINEFNIEALISLFLPYHETPHFAKMNTILAIKPNTTWSVLLPYKEAAKAVPRNGLVKEMKRNSEVARKITQLLPDALKGGDLVYRTLVAFNAATLHDFISTTKTFDEGTLAYLIPALLEPLQNATEKEAILGSYILLSTLSHKANSLSPTAVKSLLVSIIGCAEAVQVTQTVNALVSVCEGQAGIGMGAQDEDGLPNASVKLFLKIPGIVDEMKHVLDSGYQGAENLVMRMLGGLGRRSVTTCLHPGS